MCLSILSPGPFHLSKVKTREPPVSFRDSLCLHQPQKVASIPNPLPRRALLTVSASCAFWSKAALEILPRGTWVGDVTAGSSSTGGTVGPKSLDVLNVEPRSKLGSCS